MNLRLLAMALIVVLFVEGCNTSYEMTTVPHEDYPWAEKQHRTYGDFLARAEGKTVQIVTKDGSHLRGRITRADADSIGWVAPKDSVRHVLPTSAVQSLDISHNYGFHGLIIGFLATTIPNIIGGNFDVPPAGNSSEPDYGHLQPAITEAVLGGLVGMLGGILITHTDTYTISPPND